MGYLGEIRLFAGNFAPGGWLLCNGQAVLISEYEALFSTIGTMYGGNGTTYFNVPNLTGSVPIHSSNNFPLAEYGTAPFGLTNPATLVSMIAFEGSSDEPYTAEVRTFGFKVTPSHWMPCNGQLLPIQSNPALYSILGTRYGGDGVSTFALPDLQGKAVVSDSAEVATGIGWLALNECICINGVFPRP
jgi:microcystin-dependent protein